MNKKIIACQIVDFNTISAKLHIIDSDLNTKPREITMVPKGSYPLSVGVSRTDKPMLYLVTDVPDDPKAPVLQEEFKYLAVHSQDQFLDIYENPADPEDPQMLDFIGSVTCDKGYRVYHIFAVEKLSALKDRIGLPDETEEQPVELGLPPQIAAAIADLEVVEGPEVKVSVTKEVPIDIADDAGYAADEKANPLPATTENNEG